RDAGDGVALGRLRPAAGESRRARTPRGVARLPGTAARRWSATRLGLARLATRALNPIAYSRRHGEDRAEADASGDHPVVGFRGAFEREGLHHGPDPQSG